MIENPPASPCISGWTPSRQFWPDAPGAGGSLWIMTDLASSGLLLQSQLRAILPGQSSLLPELLTRGPLLLLTLSPRLHVTQQSTREHRSGARCWVLVWELATRPRGKQTNCTRSGEGHRLAQVKVAYANQQLPGPQSNTWKQLEMHTLGPDHLHQEL